MAEGRGSGCLKMLGIGCAVMIVVSAVGGYIIYRNAGPIARSVAAATVEQSMASMLDRMKYPAAEKDAAMKPVRAFAQDIRDGRVTVNQGVAVLVALAAGPAFPIMMRGFEVKYLLDSTLSQEEKDAGHVNISRFVHGVTEKKIDKDEFEKVQRIITVETVDEKGNKSQRLRESISTEELKECLDIMTSAADEAKLAKREYKVDIAAQIETAIQKGIEEGRKK